MRILCIEDVIMVDDGEITFIKGKEYSASKKDFVGTEYIEAINEQGKEHTISPTEKENGKTFLDKHFKILEGG